MKQFSLAVVAALAVTPTLASAEVPSTVLPATGSSSSSNVYASAFAGTTVVTRASNGSVAGPSQDLTPMVGFGYVVNAAWSVEVDLGPTWVRGSGYTGFALVPGLVFTVNPYVYLCGRLITIVHPSFSFAAEPGVGVTYTFSNGWAPFAELDGIISRSSTMMGGADVSAALSVGVAKYF